jgi:lipoprotein LprG
MLLTGTLAACTKKADTSTLPDGAGLVSDSATAMAQIETMHIVVDVNPPLGNPAIAKANLDLTKKGESVGDVNVVMGPLITVAIVTTADGRSFLKLPGAGWIESGLLSQAYDVTAILDPNRGIAKLLATATNAATKGSESVNGTDCWRVSVTLSSDVVKVLVPAELPQNGLTGDVWIDKATKRMVKSVVNAPQGANNPAAVLTFTITKFNEPVTASAPI